MLRTVIPEFGRELLDRQRVLVVALGGWTRSSPHPLLRGHVCKVSLNAVSSINVTSNDVTLFGDTGSHGNHARISEERDDDTATRPTRRAPIGRLLGSGLLDLLAGPPGVDGYLEQIRPTWAVRDRRAEVIAVERQTPDSVTLALRANLAWEGFRAGPVRAGRGRDRRRAAHAAATRRPPSAGTGRDARAHRQGASRGPRLQLPDRARAPRHGRRARRRPTGTSSSRPSAPSASS